MSEQFDGDIERQTTSTNLILTRNDRFAEILIFIAVLAAITTGLFIRQRTTNETWEYVSREAGIEGSYPAAWLVDEQGAYVARIRNPRSRPFKTQYIVRTLPYGPQSSVRNVLDSLSIQRSSDLSAYRVLSIEEIQLVGGDSLTQMDFAFVDADPNPFIQRLPVVVQGRDIVIIDENRALVITFMTDQATFDENLASFERFLVSLRY